MDGSIPTNVAASPTRDVAGSRPVSDNNRPSTSSRRAPQARADCYRLLALTGTYQCRPVDRRWELANAIVARVAPPRFFREAIDADVATALQYIMHRARQRPNLPESLVELDQAFRLRFHTAPLERATLEARLLSGEPIADTALKCGLVLEVVRLYEALFFCVRDRLQNRIYIINYAIGPRYLTGYLESDVDIILKSLAYLKGPLFLEYLLPYFTTPWQIPDRLDGLTVGQLRDLHYRLSIKAMIAALTIPKNIDAAANDHASKIKAAMRWDGLASEVRQLIASLPAKSAATPTQTALSPASARRLIDSFATTRPAGVPSSDGAAEALTLVG